MVVRAVGLELVAVVNEFLRKCLSILDDLLGVRLPGG